MMSCCLRDTMASRSLAKLYLPNMMHCTGMYGRCRGKLESAVGVHAVCG